MTPFAGIPGEVDEWHEIEPGRWARRGHPEDGVMTLRDGLTFADYFAENRAPKRTVPKSVIVSRLIAAGKIEAAYAALNSDPAAWARWVASDRPAINHDDPDAIALLNAIGADPDVILGP